MNPDPTSPAANSTSSDVGRLAATPQERLARLAVRRAAATAQGSSGRSDGDSASGEVIRPARRRHPARKSRVAALGLSLASTTAMSALFAYSDRSPAAATLAHTATATPLRSAASPLPPTAAVATATLPPLVAPTVVPTTAIPTKKVLAPAGATFTGAVSSNRWGPVQVQITVTNGKITKVTALQTPSDKSKSVRINNRAVPILRSEALAAQSAQVNTVSGATYTSDSYAASLQSAIDSARSAGFSVA